MKISDIVEFNPTRTLKKGTLASFVEMAAVPEYVRDIAYVDEKEFSSGSKFKNGDTLFARITPCLENGKTAKVNCLRDDEIAHGSTEFIVMAPISEDDEDFIYYLSRDPEFREFAKSRMQGTSGRQRVSWQSLADYELPDIEPTIRKRIGEILKGFDDKIALNREINQTLEAMAQAIFKSWFVDFEPFKEGEFVESELGMIPKGWEVKSIGDIIELAYGKALGKEIRQDGNIPVYGSGGITGFHNEALVKAPGIIVGRKGTVGSVYWASNDFYPIDTVFYVKPKQELSLYWIYEVLRTMDIKQFSADSAVPGVNRNVIQAQIVVVSDIETMQKFDNHIKSYIDLIDQNQKQIETLSTLRDTLLPKLLNGEIEV